MSKQSNSGSIHPSIGGIETELVVSRGQEILTGDLCRQAGGCAHTTAQSGVTTTAYIGKSIQIYVETHVCLGQSYRPPRYTAAFAPTRRRSSHTSTFRSCLAESEQSASSLSQSEGIQSASTAEYQAGCRRVSQCSTDTVDSSALFMGTDEMASH